MLTSIVMITTIAIVMVIMTTILMMIMMAVILVMTVRIIIKSFPRKFLSLHVLSCPIIPKSYFVLEGRR